jgi:hypothetical protein
MRLVCTGNYMFSATPPYMKFIIIIIFTALLFISPLTAQLIRESEPPSFAFLKKSAVEIPSRLYDTVNTNLLLQQDLEFPLPLRYGICRNLQIDLQQAGLRDELQGYGYIRRFLVVSAGAKALGLNFSLFRLPPGAGLWLYDPKHRNILGAVGAENNHPEGELTLPELPGDSLIIEYFEPYGAEFTGSINLAQVIHAYREKSALETDATSGQLTSNLATRCPSSRPYWDMKHAVCRMTFNDMVYAYLCTGFLINNTANNGTPYFVTANHCINQESLANTLITYFNYEEASCNVSGTSPLTISGSTLLFTVRESDFTLLKLGNPPPPSYQPVFAGWDISDTAMGPVHMIHHPGGASKVISISNDTVLSNTTSIYWQGGSTTPAKSHWQVNITSGKTVGGSSGCPLFDKNYRAIGQLHGGDQKTDYYGKLAYTYKMRADSFLKYLDPAKSGVHALDQYIPASNYPEPFFDINLRTPCLFESVKLINQTLFNADTFSWEILNNDTGNMLNIEFMEGTNSGSFEPVVKFTKRGTYTVSLFSGRGDTIHNQTSRYDLVVADTALRLVTTGIPADLTICGNQLKEYLISTQGALDYTYSFDENSDRLFITGEKGMRNLTLNKALEGLGSFILPLTISGTQGGCTASTRYNLNFKIASNNEPENAIQLEHGDNGPFSNECADSWETEPYPETNDCYGQQSWCRTEDNYGVLQNSVWFKINGPPTGKMGIRLTGLDAQIALYQAEDAGEFRGGTGNVLLLAANDNQLNTKEPEIYSLSVNPEKNYWLQVDGSTYGQTGPFNLIVLQEEVTFYPNPTKGMLTLEIGFEASENIRVEVSEMQGRLVRAITKESLVAGEKLQLDLTDLPTGMYLVHFNSSRSSAYSKILKL